MTLAEARLPDFLLDLHDQYGMAFPKPAGMVINFTLIRENTTYKKAKAEIETILTLHGLTSVSITISPGLENPAKVNRSIKLAVPKDLLM